MTRSHVNPPLFSRAWRRRWHLGLATLLGRPRGWFIPHRYAGSLPPPESDAELEALFRATEPRFTELLLRLESVADGLARITDNAAPPAPRWAQAWFPRLDAAIAYLLVRERRPRRIVEIGSGHSTRFLARAVADGGLPTGITAIDPAPRTDLAGLPLTLIRKTLQQAGEEAFRELSAGDLLLIDSSHILMPGSDVDILFNRVVPRLPVGVLLQVHDVFLPDPYPADWAWRGYNEQLALPPLLHAGRLRLVFSSHYATTRLAEAVAASPAGRLSLLEGAIESALWLETA